MVDEEKGPEKNDLENKNTKKDYLADFLVFPENSGIYKKCYPHSEKFHPSPFLEKLTPPPIFC